MIRNFLREDLAKVMEIWLNANFQAHDFITHEYWISNYNMVEKNLPKAEVYVYEDENMIKGFVGVDNGYIAGLFISSNQQSKGLGKELLEAVKSKYKELKLRVYKNNVRAVYFYQREGFEIIEKRVDKNTGELEYLMIWRK